MSFQPHDETIIRHLEKITTESLTHALNGTIIEWPWEATLVTDNDDAQNTINIAVVDQTNPFTVAATARITIDIAVSTDTAEGNCDACENNKPCGQHPHD